ncbi:MAG: nucleotidyl transferase AbiEii/AbiGii toxin family protein [Anaerolineae bacterium]
MISLREVQQIAYRAGVSARMIERDYVLTWVLAGIAGHPALGPAMVLKGGTALKKVYFAEWRYSEDLDFTARSEIASDILQGYLDDVSAVVHDEAEIETQIASVEPRRDGSVLRNITVYLSYVGPLRRTRRWRQLKLDFTFDELIVSQPVRRSVRRTYSDEPEPAPEVLVYSLEEICAEKLRTLLQRTQPRDLYDVWRILTEQPGMLDLFVVSETFRQKCHHKGLSPDDLANVLVPERVEKIRRAWQVHLADQITDVPPLNQIVRETARSLRTHLLS